MPTETEMKVLRELSGGAKLVARISGAIYLKQQQGSVWAVSQSDYEKMKRQGWLKRAKQQTQREGTEYVLSSIGLGEFRRNHNA